ncbi:hypothetical protein VA249_24910 [Vibrio alfacsensis]|nr:hypothetical protein VA249_24910 [Vibrio alfacsensis]
MNHTVHHNNWKIIKDQLEDHFEVFFYASVLKRSQIMMKLMNPFMNSYREMPAFSVWVFFPSLLRT